MATQTKKLSASKPRKNREATKSKAKHKPIIRGSHKDRRALTRNKVLEAGITVLGEQGFHAASSSNIAKHAGVSRGALLHQFPTNNDLMMAIVEHIIAKNHDRNHRLLATLSPGIDQFKALTDALWETSKYPDVIALIEIHMASRSNRELSKSLSWKIEALFRSELDSTWRIAQEAGIEDRRAVNALSTLTIAGIWGLSIMRLQVWKPDELEDAFGLLQTNRDFFIGNHSSGH